MTIFGQCHNVLNNKYIYWLCSVVGSQGIVVQAPHGLELPRMPRQWRASGNEVDRKVDTGLQGVGLRRAGSSG